MSLVCPQLMLFWNSILRRLVLDETLPCLAYFTNVSLANVIPASSVYSHGTPSDSSKPGDWVITNNCTGIGSKYAVIARYSTDPFWAWLMFTIIFRNMWWMPRACHPFKIILRKSLVRAVNRGTMRGRCPIVDVRLVTLRSVSFSPPTSSAVCVDKKKK